MGLLILAAIWVGLVISQVLPPQTDEQQAALKILDQARSQRLGERNAYALLWLFNYDIDEAQIRETMDLDLELYTELLELGATDDSFQSVAEPTSTKLPGPAYADWRCTVSAGACLDEIRPHADELRLELSEYSARLARLDALSEYDHVATEFPMGLTTPLISNFQPGRMQLIASAMAHLDGESERAIERLCTSMGTWRQLSTHTDSLVFWAVAQMSIAEHIRLAGEILAERPDLDDTACLSVFDPLHDEELDQCRLVAAEFEGFKRAMSSIVPEGAKWSLQVGGRFVNSDMVITKQAEQSAYYCQQDHRLQIARRDPDSAPEVACSASEWAFAPYACGMFADLPEAFGRYYRRALDTDAHLKLLQVGRWLRDNDNGEPWELQLARVPQGLRSVAHKLSYDAERSEVRLSLLDGLFAEEVSIPIRRTP